MKRANRVSLNVRYGFTLFLLMMALALSLTHWYSNKLHQASDEALEYFSISLQHNLEEQLTQTGRLLASTISDSLVNPMAYHSYSEIGDLIKQAMSDHEVVYLLVYDNEGKLIHDGSDNVFNFGEPASKRFAEYLHPENILLPYHIVHQNEVHVSQPILADNELPIGLVRLGMRFPLLEKGIAEFNQTMEAGHEKISQEMLQNNFYLFIFFALIACFASWVIAQKMTQPIRHLSSLARAIGLGNYHHKIEINQNSELGELAENLDQMRLSLQQKVAKIQTQAYIDELTNLPNRHNFNQSVDDYIASEQAFELLYIDLDDFKNINDQFGHEVGDLYLQESCRVIEHYCQDYFKTSQPFKLFRIGGDELSLTILAEHFSATGIQSFAVQFCQHVCGLIKVGNLELQLSMSVGVARFPQDADNRSQLLSNADMAMYKAKELGKQQAVLFNQSLQQVVLDEYALRERLTTAIKEQQFYLNYQPIIDAQTQRCLGLEALVRLGVGETFISPAEFIPLAEKMNIIEDITYQVFHMVCEDIASQPDMHLKVSINISGQLIDQPHFYDGVIDIVHQAKVPANQIALEVTETSMITNMASAIEGMKRFKKQGFTIYLDDFGTGYSSLSYLQNLPMDVVKFDRSIIQQTEPGDRLFSSIVNLCKALDLKLVIEGVETKEQLSICHQAKCDMIQGYYFSKPVRWQDALNYSDTHAE